MDLASVIGFIGAVGMIVLAMLLGGGVSPFIDPPSLAIVGGGTFFAVMYNCPPPAFFSSFGVMGKASACLFGVTTQNVDLSWLGKRNNNGPG